MSRLYEAMFLVDNDTVRASWQQAKASVAGLIEKHGGKVCTARRWGERRLAYPIHRRNRATYLLTYVELDPEKIPNLHLDIEINEMVLRHLLMRTDVVPAEEVELSELEAADDFVVPEPPADDAIDEPKVESEDKKEPAAGNDMGITPDEVPAVEPAAPSSAPVATAEAGTEAGSEAEAGTAAEAGEVTTPAAKEEEGPAEKEEKGNDEPEKTEG